MSVPRRDGEDPFLVPEHDFNNTTNRLLRLALALGMPVSPPNCDLCCGSGCTGCPKGGAR